MADETEGLKRVAYADIPEDQRFTWRLVPSEGRLLNAETVGQTLHQVCRVIKTADKEFAPGRMYAALMGVRLNEDGSFEADIAMLPVKKRKPVDPST